MTHVREIETDREDVVVRKSWGHEVWFENNNLYCGKSIWVDNDIWSSDGKWHMHKKKDETFYVIYGKLILMTKDNHGNTETIELSVGDSYRIKPFTKHKFTAGGHTNCNFIEVSTHHDDYDSYRSDD